ncbi:MAG: hypothetical protein IPP74_07940 [Alphaproteobacteria bacterium]|nr:hypothetical protein [Alphaproteobacteria bacterium]
MLETEIESNKLLEEKQQNQRNEIRLHQFKLVDLANNYASTGLRTIVILNAGALSLIPTFITAFRISKINPDMLGAGMVFFVFSILSVLSVYLFGYLSSSFVARSCIEESNCRYWTLNICHFIERQRAVPQDWSAKEQYHRKKVNRWVSYANVLEVVAIILTLSALFFFFLGTIYSIKALPVNILVSQTGLVPEIKNTEKISKNCIIGVVNERKTGNSH